MNSHISKHISNTKLRSDNTLHVIAVISNPVRYQSRYRLYKEFEKEMLNTPNTRLYTVEAAHGDRYHEITSADNDKHLQVRAKSEIWNKENLINLGVKHLLPFDWKYVAWIDADVFFNSPNWAQETLHQLQHFAVVQPYQQCIDLGLNGNIMNTYQSFGWIQQKNYPTKITPYKKYGSSSFPHSGYAWASTRNFWEAVGGLPDFCILGSGDYHIAWACIGQVQKTIQPKLHNSYLRYLLDWQTRAMRVTKGNVGYVPGYISHSFHGSKRERFYQSRWQILLDNKFDPVNDLFYDEQGLIELNGKPKLEYAIMQYNRSRNEDSTEEK